MRPQGTPKHMLLAVFKGPPPFFQHGLSLSLPLTTQMEPPPTQVIKILLLRNIPLHQIYELLI